MHRRSFIKNIAIALPAISLADILLSSCCKKPIEPDKKTTRIGIIGAGVSGLNAALLLHNLDKYEIEILEAADDIGGRVLSKEDKDFSLKSIELGADTVFGNDNAWYNIVKGFRPAEINQNAVNAYIFDNKVQLESQMQTNSDFVIAKNTISDAINYMQSADVTLEQFMFSKGVPEAVKFVFKNAIEYHAGSSINEVAIKGFVEDNALKITSKQYVVVGQSLTDILKLNFAPVLPKVSTNCVVNEINYIGDEIQVSTSKGEKKYDKLIITVPLAILKAGDIKFEPALPEGKKASMDLMDTGAGIKVILKIGQDKFWPDGGTNLYSNIVMNNNADLGMFRISNENTVSKTYLLTTLIKGKDAELMENMSDDEIIQNIKSNLDRGLPGLNASAQVLTWKIQRWTKLPFSKGTVSYLKKGGSQNNRRELAKNIDNKLFFAGEATNFEGKSGTVHGAMETAITAVNELVASLH